MKDIFVFGNPDVPEDALPLKIVPRLKEKFSFVHFHVVDPNEEWDMPEEVVIIDTIINANTVKIFYGLEQFVAAPRVTTHDFDALAQLRYLQKLGKIKKVTVIGVPSMISEDEAFEAVSEMLIPNLP